MAVSTSVVVLGLVVFRSVQGAAAPVLISGAVAPLTRQEHRATLLSMNSLAGRLGYGIVLLVISTGADDDVLGVLGVLAIVAWIMVGVLIVTGWWARRGPEAPSTA